MDTKLKAAVIIFMIAVFTIFLGTKPTSDRLTIGQIQSNASKDDPTSLYLLGLMYLDGRNENNNIEKNPEKALGLFEKAAEKGHPVAAYHAGVLHNDPARKEFYWLRAVELGYNDALLELAKVLMQQGRTSEGLTWLKTASEHGDDNAKLLLSHLLYEGAGIQKDRVQSILLLQDVFVRETNEERAKNMEKQLQQWTKSLSSKEQALLTQATVNSLTKQMKSGVASPNSTNPKGPE